MTEDLITHLAELDEKEDPEEPCPELRQLLAAEPFAEDFAGLLYRLPLYEALAPKDQKNLDTYLGRCPEYADMRGHFDRLTSVLNNLPSRVEFYYEEKIAEEIRHLEFGMQNFSSHVLEIAKRLNGGSPCSLTHREEARAYFENYQVLEAGVYSFAFYSEEDVLTDTLESHLRRRAEREKETADFLNEIASVFLKRAINDSRHGFRETAEKYFKAASLADAGVTEGVVLPDRELPVDNTPAPPPPEPLEPPEPAQPAEDLVSLLGHLSTTPSWTPEDHANFNRYLENCGEYTKMQNDLARLNSIFPHLKASDDKQNRYQVMVKANDLNSQIREFKERVLKAAHRIAAGDPEKEPAVWRAAECFNGFFMEEAEFFAFPDTTLTDQWSYQELENEWGRYVDDRFRWGPSQDRMEQFFIKLADDFLELAYEKTSSTDAAAPEEAERYYKASIRAFPARTNLVCYGVFLENNSRSVEAAQIFCRVLDDIEMEELDVAALQHLLGKIELENDLYEHARDTLLESVATRRKLLFDDPDAHTLPLGKDLSRLGRAYFHLGEDEKAREYLDEGLEISREVRKKDPDNIEPDIMEAAGALGQLYASAPFGRDLDRVEKYLSEAAGIARKISGDNRYYKTRRAFFLAALAAVHEQLLDIDAAESEFNETEDIYRELVVENPEIYELGLAQRANMLARFLQEHRYGPDERERSLWLATEAFVTALEYKDDESAINIALVAQEILEKWEVPADELGSKMRIQEAIVKARRKTTTSE
jgi:hypothetical protein